MLLHQTVDVESTDGRPGIQIYGVLTQYGRFSILANENEQRREASLGHNHTDVSFVKGKVENVNPSDH